MNIVKRRRPDYHFVQNKYLQNNLFPLCAFQTKHILQRSLNIKRDSSAFQNISQISTGSCSSDSQNRLVRPSVRWSVTEKYRIIDSCTIHTCMPRSITIDMCIIHTCIRVNDQGKLINASYMHVSGSRVMDKCIIGRCIMVTCIRIKNICIAHAYMLQDQG